MRNGLKIGSFGLAALLWLATAVPAQAGGRVEGFAGYYFAEELEEDLSFGVRGTWESDRGWGLMLGYESFDTDGKGYGEPRGVDGKLQHLELSYLVKLGSSFELFSGIGTTDVNVDTHVPGASVDLDKSSFSIHAGLAYRMDLGDVLYLRPEARARLYKVGDETIDYTGSIALGFRWGSGR